MTLKTVTLEEERILGAPDGHSRASGLIYLVAQVSGWLWQRDSMSLGLWACGIEC